MHCKQYRILFEFQDRYFSKLNKSLKNIDFVPKMKHKHQHYICIWFIAIKETIIYLKSLIFTSRISMLKR